MAVQYAYDGEGSRVAQHVVSFGSAWTTAYLLGDTAETTEGSGTFTDYLFVPGVGTAVETNSPTSPALSYLATDGLNSVSVALDAQGNVSGQALYFPYGPGRYFSGRFPTTHGFTGQDQDGNTTGLFYDHARYYDPSIGQFAQADTDDKGGLNRFAYVRGNPTTATDPSGHMRDCQQFDDCGSGGSGTGGGSSGGCTSENCGSNGGCYSSCCGGTPSSGGSHGGTSGSSVNLVRKVDPYSCAGSRWICLGIRLYPDSRTQTLLLLLTHSAVGLQFLSYLLTMGPPFIQWGHGVPQTDFLGFIHMDLSLLPGRDASPAEALSMLVGAAGGLIHEAVESLFAENDGIRSFASLHMDYVAQWFAGEVRQQIAASLAIDTSSYPVPRTSAFGQSYTTWRDGPHGQAYQQLGEKDAVPELSFPGRVFAWFAGNHTEPNDMGLTTAMLQSGCVVPGACSS